MLSSNSIRTLLLGLTCPALVAATSGPALSSPQPGMLVAPSTALSRTSVQGRPDQIFRKNPRNGRVTIVAGQIIENTLDAVKLQVGNKEENVPAVQVLRIEWGETPTSYKDGLIHMDRGDYENALAQFRIAATDAATRPVVQADARLRAVHALIAWGGTNAERFAEAVEEADRFLNDYADDRALPDATKTKARALHLAGKPAEAGAIYEALYQQGVAEAKGYDAVLCLDAALAGAEAYLAASDTLKARELFKAAETGFSDLHGASADATLAERTYLLNQRGAASAGEGFCLLVGKDTSGAKSFFEGALRQNDAPSAEIHSARLGLAQIHLAAGESKEAMLLFAQVSALDSTSRDRVAAALLGLAASSQASGASNGLKVARTSLTRIQEGYGDTPSAAEAKTRLSKL